VVNISASGALVEGLTRLLPNTHTDLHIVTRHGRVLVRTRVVRALVWQLERDKVCYRTALAFETPIDTEVDPALSEPSSHRGRNDGGSIGPALSEGPSRPGRDERESNGYPLPAENPGNFSAPGTGYPFLDAEDRT
jgi:hypothetical protein